MEILPMCKNIFLLCFSFPPNFNWNKTKLCKRDFITPFPKSFPILSSIYGCIIKTIEGKGLNNCMSPTRGPCADFQSANSVGNITTAKSLQKSRTLFASIQKRYPTLEPVVCPGLYIHLYLMHLLLNSTWWNKSSHSEE